MIKYVMFDLGGVLVPESCELIEKDVCRMFRIPLDKFKDFMDKEKRKLITGEVSLSELYKLLVNKYNLDIDANEIV